MEEERNKKSGVFEKNPLSSDDHHENSRIYFFKLHRILAENYEPIRKNFARNGWRGIAEIKQTLLIA